MDPTAMDKYYGPSQPHLTTLPLLTHVKEEDEELQKDLDEEMLHENVEEMINHIIQEVLHEDDTFDEDPLTCQMRRKEWFKIHLLGHVMTSIQ